MPHAFPDRVVVRDAERKRRFSRRPTRYIFGYCLQCGEKFRKRVSSLQYCSRECARQQHPPPVRYGAANNTWKGGVPLWTCAFCGTEFNAYHKENRKARQFCSWHCANKAHGRSGNDEMRARFAFEYEALNRMEAQGFKGFRSAGSRGAFDLFVVNSTESRVIQVKSTKRPHHPGTVAMLTNAVLELQLVPCPPGLTKWLALKILRGPWLEWDITDWPKAKSDIRERVRQEMAEVL